MQLILLTINAVGLLLTFSRSVWILWLISAVAVLLLIPQLRTKKSIVYMAGCHLASLIIAMAIKQDVLFFLNRVASIQTKTLEFQIRLVYWKDSFQMFMDYLWGGTGGGGWAVLQHAYQSQEYFVKFIHNHYVQVFLDIGLIGGLCWLALIAVFVKNGLPLLKSASSTQDVENKGLFIFITVMLLHAGFDFDLTFPLMLTLLVSLMLLMPQKVMALEVKRVKLIAAGTVVILVAFFFGRMAAGYHWKEQAVRAVRANDLVYAQEQLKRAERAVPWSSSVLYESAKIYVRMGNGSGDSSHYEKAEGELLKAKGMVPEQKLYNDLLESINKNE
ncbi:O-antigen ligase family protein [Paenibacillus sp. FJAT-27812]|uniref:O-antigen ligase family protein n=1 Tax=Paenibacillus sp. FJAT-27812 TaxID=1684143 RepID=UPI0018D11B3D|nr:O-antigen ligase family protein [Paenibacillus sp. FJAT-27812]